MVGFQWVQPLNLQLSVGSGAGHDALHTCMTSLPTCMTWWRQIASSNDNECQMIKSSMVLCSSHSMMAPELCSLAQPR